MPKLNENTSRFAFLLDDVEEPLAKTVKKKSENVPGAGNKKDNKNQQKKSKGQQQPSKKASNPSPTEITKLPEAGDSNKPEEPQRKQKNSGKSEQGENSQYEEWRNRDQEFVEGSFEADLQAALMQSKLEYKAKQAESSTKVKAKKSTTTLPLADFNKLQFGYPNNPNNFRLNGLTMIDDDEVLESMREESRREIEMQRKMELEKKLVFERNTLYSEHSKEEFYKDLVKDKDRMIDFLSKENNQLKDKLKTTEEELEAVKIRFKRLCGVLSDAQMKEKVVLVAESEKLIHINEDLRSEVQNLHSQLEKEKTKSHEFLKNVNRKRSNTETSLPHE